MNLFKKSIEVTSQEFEATLALAIRAVCNISSPKIRVRLIENMKDSKTKKMMTEIIDEIKKKPTILGYFSLQEFLKQPVGEQKDKTTVEGK